MEFRERPSPKIIDADLRERWALHLTVLPTVLPIALGLIWALNQSGANTDAALTAPTKPSTILSEGYLRSPIIPETKISSWRVADTLDGLVGP